MNIYTISHNSNLNFFSVEGMFNDYRSTHNPLTDVSDADGDGWNHQTAAKLYLEQLPSDADTIIISDEGEYTFGELRAVADGERLPETNNGIDILTINS